MNRSSGIQKREKIIKEIEKVKININAYKRLQRQIQMIEKQLRVAENGVNKQSSFESPRKKRIPNSHKKIKAYELQKKVNNKQKQKKEKQLLYLKKLEYEQQILKNIEDRKRMIQKQVKDKKQLQQVQCQLDKQIYHIQYKNSQIQKLMNQEKNIVQKYDRQKQQKYENIRIMKIQLKIQSNKTQPDDSLMNISQDYQDQNYSIGSNYFQQINKNQIKRKQIIYNNQINKNIPNHQIIYQIKQQIDQRAYELQKVKQKNVDLIKLIHRLKIQNRSKQGLVKHSKTTIQLIGNKISTFSTGIQNQNNKNYDRQQKIKNSQDKLSILQGQRGRLRGKLGIRVQNVRLLGLINQQLKTDLQQLILSLQSMKKIKQRIGKFIKKDDILLQTI